MKILYTKEFVKMLERLPKSIQALFLTQEDIFRKDWRDSRLHLKKLKGKTDAYSFRVTRSYRTLFHFRSYDESVFFAIDDRKRIYRKIK